MRKFYFDLVCGIALCVTQQSVASTQEIECSVNGKKIVGHDACLAAISGQPRMNAMAAVKPDAVTVKPPRTAALPTNPVTVEAPPPVVNVFLRQSMDDLKSLSSPSKLEDATGALFSWTDDHISSNRNFTAQALIGASVSQTFLPSALPYVSESFTGAYFQIDRQMNSKDIKKNVDDLTFGGRHEFVVGNAASTSHYFGISGEVVTDSTGAAKNWNLMADYQPFGTMPDSGPRPLISYFNSPLDNLGYVLVTFSPKLQAEYRGSLDGSTDPLFKYRDRVFRLGGSMGVNIKPNFIQTNLPFFIQRSVVNVSYGWLYDTLSDRQFGYLDTAYTFNLTDNGDVGITFNYRHGKLQTTAQDVDLYKVALSAKFDYAGTGVFR